jgi:hypothetical protein
MAIGVGYRQAQPTMKHFDQMQSGHSKRNIPATIALLITTQMVSLLSLYSWLPLYLISFSAILEPLHTPILVFVLVTWIYPLLLVGCAALAWMYYWGKRDRITVMITSIPLPLTVPIVTGIIQLPYSQ